MSGIDSDAPDPNKISDQINGVTPPSDQKDMGKKGNAAILTGLNTLADEALKNSKPQGSGAPLLDAGDESDGAADSDDSSYYIPDPLTAVIMAGVSGLIAKTQLTGSTADMQEKLSQLTTQTAKTGSDWMENFYKYGQLAGSGADSMGSFDAGKAHKPGDTSVVYFKVVDGKLNMSLDNKTWQAIGDQSDRGTLPDDTVIGTYFPGYTFTGTNDDTNTANKQSFWNNTGPCCSGGVFQMTMVNNNDHEGGGTGLAGAGTSSLQQLTTQWSYVQQTVQAQNTTAGALAPIATAEQQNTITSINNGDQDRQTILNCLDGTASLVTGWSSK
jgi:hypothetical protein